MNTWRSRLKIVLWAIPLLTVVEGCVTEKRCNDKFGGRIIRDTYIKDTTIITSSTHFDTLIRLNGPDTVYYRDQITNIKVKVVRVRDSVWIHSECPPDTVTVERVRVETSVERFRNLFGDDLKRLFWGLVVVAGIMFSFGYLIKALKK